MRVAQATPPAPTWLQARRLRYAPEEVPLGDNCASIATGNRLILKRALRSLSPPSPRNSWTQILERSLTMLNPELYRRGFLPEVGAGERLRTAGDADDVIELSADDLAMPMVRSV